MFSHSYALVGVTVALAAAGLAMPSSSWRGADLAADATPAEATPTPGDVTPEPWPFPNFPMPPNWPACRTWYADCDGDGHGDPGASLYTCWNPNLSRTPPACKYLRTATDCDDTDAAISPDAVEGPEDEASTVDGLDNDCDGFVDVDCDGTSGLTEPRISLTSPARGTFTAQPSVRVEGLVLPGIARTELLPISVDGRGASMELCSRDGGARFFADVPLDVGVTTIPVWVQDSDGKGDEAMVSVAHADHFIDLSAERVEGSLVTLLNQGTWDILGDYLESYLSASEMQAELLSQNPLINESGDDDCLEEWSINGNATGYTHDAMEVTFTVSGGVIQTTARLVHPQIWATGTGYYDLEWYCGGWSDHVGLNAYASFSEVRATANGRLSLDASGRLLVRFTEVSVVASGANVNVDADDSFYDWLIDLFEDDLEDEMEDFVEDELYDYVATDLGPDLEEELNDLDLSYTVDVGDVGYGVDFRYDSLSVIQGGVNLGFDMGLSYARDPRVVDNPGAVHFSTAYTPNVSPTFGFRVGLDFFNTALHALWEGGSLHLSDTLSEDPPIFGSATPLLPPVIMPSDDGYLLELRLADVIGTVDVTLEDGTLYTFQAALSTRVPVTLTPQAVGYSLAFDVTFGPSEVEYDLLGLDALPQSIQDASEQAMGELLDTMLVDVEGYMEELELSYLGLPLQITGLGLGADAGNPAMIAVDGQAVYTGP